MSEPVKCCILKLPAALDQLEVRIFNELDQGAVEFWQAPVTWDPEHKKFIVDVRLRPHEVPGPRLHRPAG